MDLQDTLHNGQSLANGSRQRRWNNSPQTRKWYTVQPLNSSNCDDLGCMSRSFIDCKFVFYTDKRISPSLCYSRASFLSKVSRTKFQGAVPLFLDTLISLQQSVAWVEGNLCAKNQLNPSSHLDTIPACKRHTHTQQLIPSNTRASTALCG